MDLFNRIKSILFNPKEEWEVIEAEDQPQAKVLQYLLILAVIPAIAIFFDYWWQWHSEVVKITNELRRVAIERGHLTNLNEELNAVKELLSFNLPLGIIKSVKILIFILGGAYLAAAVINLLSEQFGLQKNFNRAFSLVAFSYTPFCIAGVLYAYEPLAQYVPFVGLYGIYLLYLGIKPLFNPIAEKLTGYFVMAMTVTLAAYIVTPKIVQPITDNISKNILIEQLSNKEYKGRRIYDNNKIESLKELTFYEIEDIIKKQREIILKEIR